MLEGSSSRITVDQVSDELSVGQSDEWVASPSLTEVRVGVGRVGSGVGVGGVCRVGGVGSGSGVGSSVGCAVGGQWGSSGVGHWGSDHGWLGSNAGHDGEQAESELGEKRKNQLGKSVETSLVSFCNLQA